MNTSELVIAQAAFQEEMRNLCGDIGIRCALLRSDCALKDKRIAELEAQLKDKDHQITP